MNLYLEDEHFLPRHWLLLLALGCLYAIFTVAQWTQGYIDFGDGNYMYIGWRIAQGAVPYRDILAPQPPCHLFLGAAIARLADLFRIEPLFLFRAFSVLLHLATFTLVVTLAWRAWRRPATAVLAGAIYLWLPIGYWWSLGYQSEPLEIFFLLFMVLLSLRGSWWSDLLAGLFAAAAALTNATAAPFELVLIVFMLIRAPWRALRMAAVTILVAGAVTAWLQWWTAGAFLRDTVINQTGTFYGFNYAITKLLREGNAILFREGVFLTLALVGVWRLLRQSPLSSIPRAGLAWFCLATLGSIFYVTKGGTEDYIFSLAEPAIAILAAGELAAIARRGWTTVPDPETGWNAPTVPFKTAKLVALGLLLFYAVAPGLDLYYNVWHQSKPYELPEPATLAITRLLKRYAGPFEPVLAPPYYAFLAGRRIAGDYSELFIWSDKDSKDRVAAYDRLAAQPRMGLDPKAPYGQKLFIDQRLGIEPEGEGWLKIATLARMLDQKEIPIAIIEMDQTGTKPEIMRALERNYEPLAVGNFNAINRHVPYNNLRDVLLAGTNNTRLGIFIPVRGDAPETLAEQRQLWQTFKADLAKVYQGEVNKFALWYTPPMPDGGGAGVNPPTASRAGMTTATQPTATPTPAATPSPTPVPSPAVSATPTSPTAMPAKRPESALPTDLAPARTERPSTTPAQADEATTTSTEPLSVVRLPGLSLRKSNDDE